MEYNDSMHSQMHRPMLSMKYFTYNDKFPKWVTIVVRWVCIILKIISQKNKLCKNIDVRTLTDAGVEYIIYSTVDVD